MKIEREKAHSVIFKILLYAFVIALPCTSSIFFNITPWICALLSLNWLIWGHWQERWKLLKTKKIFLPIVALVALYLSLVYGLTISQGKAWIELFEKLPFLFLPAVILLNSFQWEKKFLKSLSLVFAIACVATLLLFLVRSFVIASDKSDFASYYYGVLSWYHHAAYLSIIFNAAFGGLVYAQMRGLFAKNNWVLILLTSVLAIGIVLLGSRSALIAFFVTVLVFCWYFLFVEKKIKQTALFVMPSVLAFLLVFFAIPKETNRTVAAVSQLKNHSIYQENIPTDWRLQAWHVAWNISKETFPKGSGTADLSQLQLRQYLEQGFDVPYKYHFNAHNQYLQTLAATGLLGITILLAVLFLPIGFGFSNKNIVAVVLALLLIFNFVFESMLERQVGILFFSFFYPFSFLPFFTHENSNDTRSETAIC